jgi:hypothetical protein
MMKKSLYSLILFGIFFTALLYCCANRKTEQPATTFKSDKSLDEQIDELEKFRNKLWEKKREAMKKFKARFEKLQTHWDQLQDKIVLRTKKIIDKLNLKNSELYKLIEDRDSSREKITKRMYKEDTIDYIEEGVRYERILENEQIRKWNERIEKLSNQKNAEEEALISAAKAKDTTLNKLKQEAEKIEKQIEDLFKEINNDITIKNLAQQIDELSPKIRALYDKKRNDQKE